MIPITQNMTSVELLWKTRETVLRMLSDRGFSEADDYRLDWETFEEWADDDDISTIKEAMTLVIHKKSKIAFVYWLPEPKLGDQLQTFLLPTIQELSDDPKNVVTIVITDEGVTPSATATIKNLAKKKIVIEIFKTAEITFPIVDHEFVPKHVACSVAEKKQIFKAYNINNANGLPSIATDDAVVRYFGIKKGQLVRIHRPSETQPGCFTITYRICK